MSFSDDHHHLTPSGSSFVLGFMAHKDPQLAAEALETLRKLAASGPMPPEYWIKTPGL